jgi:hypothetical protein
MLALPTHGDVREQRYIELAIYFRGCLAPKQSLLLVVDNTPQP